MPHAEQPLAARRNVALPSSTPDAGDRVTLTHSEVLELLKVIDEFGVGELRLELGELKLHIVKGQPAAPAGAFERDTPMVASASEVAVARAVTPPAPPAAKAAPAVEANGRTAIASPTLGTFYRAPAPDAPPFVEPGQLVEPDTPIGIIEIMKLMNTIPAGVRGRICEVVAHNATLVEFGQVLMYVEPSDAAHA